MSAEDLEYNEDMNIQDLNDKRFRLDIARSYNDLGDDVPPDKANKAIDEIDRIIAKKEREQV